MHTAAEEDYLKTMLDLEESGDPVTTTSLAGRLGIRPASVTGMLQRLAERRLITYRPYQAVRLTPKGRAAALATLRRHRLIELFLVRILGLPWDQVHAEAERWEHVVSEPVIEKMDEVLGRPTRDPHGAPIPRTDGGMTIAATRPLAEFGPGARARVAQLPDRDPEFLRYLGGLGIVPDAVVEILQVEPFNGPLTVRIGRRKAVVGRETLRQVLATTPADALTPERKPR